MFYGDADGFITYQQDRGKEITALWTDEEIESALLVASEWLDNYYSTLWVGYPTGGFEQVREWPRTDATVDVFPAYTFATDAIPDRVKHATYEAAYRELVSAGSLYKDYTPPKFRNVQVDGAVSVTHNLSVNGAFDVQMEIPAVKALMKPLLDVTSGGNHPFSGRAVRV